MPKVEKEVRVPFPVFFSVCVLHPGHPPVCSITTCFVSGQGWLAKRIVCEIACAHEQYSCICVPGCLCVYVHGVHSGGRGTAFTAHHLHFHTQFVMSVTRQGESWGSHQKKMAASTSQMGEEKGPWHRKDGGGVAMWPVRSENGGKTNK